MTNKTLPEIQAEYELRAAAKQRRFEQRCMQDKEICALQQSLRTLLAQKLILEAEQPPSEALNQKVCVTEAQLKAETAQKFGAPRYACPICKDTGSRGGRLCSCLRREAYVQIFEARDTSAVKGSFDAFDLSVFDDSLSLASGKTQRQMMQIFVRACKDYAEQSEKIGKRNMLLAGKAGLGKTFLLEAMAAHAAGRGTDVCLIGAGMLYEAFFQHRMGADVPLELLRTVDFLLIDDLGAEPITQNVSVEYLFDLLNTRNENGKRTAVATNAANLKNRYDERIYSRLTSKKDCLALYFDGADLRMT